MSDKTRDIFSIYTSIDLIIIFSVTIRMRKISNVTLSLNIKKYILTKRKKFLHFVMIRSFYELVFFSIFAQWAENVRSRSSNAIANFSHIQPSVPVS